MPFVKLPQNGVTVVEMGQVCPGAVPSCDRTRTEGTHDFDSH